MGSTTIMVSDGLKRTLASMKLYENETYEDIISGLIEDRKLLNQETIEQIEQAKEEAKRGETITLEEIKKKMQK